jgi:hypothetical protein
VSKEENGCDEESAEGVDNEDENNVMDKEEEDDEDEKDDAAGNKAVDVSFDNVADFGVSSDTPTASDTPTRRLHFGDDENIVSSSKISSCVYVVSSYPQSLNFAHVISSFARQICLLRQ